LNGLKTQEGSTRIQREGLGKRGEEEEANREIEDGANNRGFLEDLPLMSEDMLLPIPKTMSLLMDLNPDVQGTDNFSED